MKNSEDLINQKIKEDIKVVRTIEDKDKALKSGAMAFFRENYPDKVSVYTIGDFSKELCGGPHVGSTGTIGSVKLIKQESIGAGKRRIYAVLKGVLDSGLKINHDEKILPSLEEIKKKKELNAIFDKVKEKI